MDVDAEIAGNSASSLNEVTSAQGHEMDNIPEQMQHNSAPEPINTIAPNSDNASKGSLAFEIPFVEKYRPVYVSCIKRDMSCVRSCAFSPT